MLHTRCSAVIMRWELPLDLLSNIYVNMQRTERLRCMMDSYMTLNLTRTTSRMPTTQASTQILTLQSQEVTTAQASTPHSLIVTTMVHCLTTISAVSVSLLKQVINSQTTLKLRQAWHTQPQSHVMLSQTLARTSWMVHGIVCMTLNTTETNIKAFMAVLLKHNMVTSGDLLLVVVHGGASGKTNTTRRKLCSAQAWSSHGSSLHG